MLYQNIMVKMLQSGEIQLAADFYGTSSVAYLVNGTITSGSATAKTAVTIQGFTKVHNTGSTIGSTV